MRLPRLSLCCFIAVMLLSNCRPAAVAEIPTLAVLPTLNPTATVTLPPTASETPAPTSTYTPSLTITMTRTPATSPTVDAAYPVAPQLTVVQSAVYYALGTAAVYSCPQLACNQVGLLEYGNPIVVAGIVEGDETEGNRLWYQVNFRNQTAYIHSTLIAQTLPAATRSIFTLPPLIRVPPTSSVACPDINAFCSALTCEQAYACVRAGNPNIDGDHDGRPCERQCGH